MNYQPPDELGDFGSIADSVCGRITAAPLTAK
jgi:hypothetical protein